MPKLQATPKCDVPAGHPHLCVASSSVCALQTNVLLQSADLSWNGFGDAGARWVGEALRVNSALEELDLAWVHVQTPHTHTCTFTHTVTPHTHTHTHTHIYTGWGRLSGSTQTWEELDLAWAKQHTYTHTLSHTCTHTPLSRTDTHRHTQTHTHTEDGCGRRSESTGAAGLGVSRQKDRHIHTHTHVYPHKPQGAQSQHKTEATQPEVKVASPMQSDLDQGYIYRMMHKNNIILNAICIQVSECLLLFSETIASQRTEPWHWPRGSPSTSHSQCWRWEAPGSPGYHRPHWFSAQKLVNDALAFLGPVIPFAICPGHTSFKLFALITSFPLVQHPLPAQCMQF